jgi:hypothetical protein
MDWTLVILFAAFLLLLLTFPLSNRRENSNFELMEQSLIAMGQTGDFAGDDRFSAFFRKLNVTSPQQMDRYIVYHYRELTRELEKQKAHIIAVSVLAGLVFLAGIIVPAVFQSDFTRSFWVERIYEPFNEILMGIFIFALVFMLLMRNVAKKTLWVYWEYLVSRGRAA